jgi:hypothetical protein
VPDRGEQIIPGDDAVAVPHQVNKEIENLGLDRHRRASPVQFPPIRVEYAVLEKIAQERIPLVAPGESVTRGPQRKNGGNAKRSLMRPERLRRRPLAWQTQTDHEEQNHETVLMR